MKHPLYVGIAIGLSVGLLVHIPLDWTSGKHSIADVIAKRGEQVRSGHGKYTNPLLECEVGAETIATQKINFGNELKDFVHSVESRSGISKVSVFYRDLNNGPTFGANENSPFVPASLLKVPVLMAYYKLSEEKPEILREQFLFTKKLQMDVMTNSPSEMKLEIGKKYSADDLIDRMITYSDNEALLTLFDHLPQEEHKRVYELSGIPASTITDPTAEVSVRQYASFFRILFNSSFLTQEKSEKALGLMTKSTFVDGIRQGIPASIEVSHKFGERKINEGEQQLHDCGIVYFPNKPILLCIMTRGEKTDDLKKAIVDVSTFVAGKVTGN